MAAKSNQANICFVVGGGITKMASSDWSVKCQFVDGVGGQHDS